MALITGPVVECPLLTEDDGRLSAANAIWTCPQAAQPWFTASNFETIVLARREGDIIIFSEPIDQGPDSQGLSTNFSERVNIVRHNPDGSVIVVWASDAILIGNDVSLTFHSARVDLDMTVTRDVDVLPVSLPVGTLHDQAIRWTPDTRLNGITWLQLYPGRATGSGVWPDPFIKFYKVTASSTGSLSMEFTYGLPNSLKPWYIGPEPVAGPYFVNARGLTPHSQDDTFSGNFPAPSQGTLFINAELGTAVVMENKPYFRFQLNADRNVTYDSHPYDYNLGPDPLVSADTEYFATIADTDYTTIRDTRTGSLVYSLEHWPYGANSNHTKFLSDGRLIHVYQSSAEFTSDGDELDLDPFGQSLGIDLLAGNVGDDASFQRFRFMWPISKSPEAGGFRGRFVDMGVTDDGRVIVSWDDFDGGVDWGWMCIVTLEDVGGAPPLRQNQLRF